MRDPNSKKLTLTKETLMTLQGDDLENVMSGAQRRPAPRPRPSPRPGNTRAQCVVTVSINFCSYVVEAGRWAYSKMFCHDEQPQQPQQPQQ